MIEDNLPNSWELVKLVEELNFIPTGVINFKGTKKYYSTGSIQDNEFTPEGEFTFTNRPSRANRVGELGDVLQARMKATDKGILVDEKLNGQLFSTGFLQVRPFSNTYDNKLLYYLIKSDLFLSQKNDLATGSTQEALTDNGASEIEIPLPPLAEQHRIVAKLDAVMQKVKSNKLRLDKIPKLLKRFRQSVLAAAVNGKLTEEWRVKNGKIESAENFIRSITKSKREFQHDENGWIKLQLNELFKSFGGGTPSRSENSYWNGSISWVSSGDVKTDLIFNGSETITQLGLENSSAKICPVDSVIVVVRSGILQHTFPVSIVKKELSINQDLKCFDSNNKILNYWLFLIFKGRSQEILSYNREGTTVQSVKMETLNNLEIEIPTLEEQKEIVRKVEQLLGFADKLEDRYAKVKAMLDKLPQSILAKAFRGELVAQDPNDEPASVLLERIKKGKEKLSAEKKGKKSKEYSTEENPIKIAAEKKVKYKKAKV